MKTLSHGLITRKAKSGTERDGSKENLTAIPACYINLARKLAARGYGGNAKQFASLIISVIKE
jgi:hypothetical protein